MTDESPIYTKIGEGFSLHGTVNHSANEYARAYFWHSNTAEGYFRLLKRAVSARFIMSAKPICIAIQPNRISNGTLAK